MSNYKIILSGGGTGGHIYPAIAIANELKSRFPDAEFLFVGASGSYGNGKSATSRLLISKAYGFLVLQRKLTLKNLMFSI